MIFEHCSCFMIFIRFLLKDSQVVNLLRLFMYFCVYFTILIKKLFIHFIMTLRDFSW